MLLTNWRQYPPIHDAEALEPFGIHLRRPMNNAAYHITDDGLLVKEVGDLLAHADGTVYVFPRRDITTTERGVLLGVAEHDFRDRRESRRTWHRYTYKGERRMRTTIYLRANVGDDPIARQIAADRCIFAEEDRAAAERDALSTFTRSDEVAA